MLGFSLQVTCTMRACTVRSVLLHDVSDAECMMPHSKNALWDLGMQLQGAPDGGPSRSTNMQLIALFEDTRNKQALQHNTTQHHMINNTLHGQLDCHKLGKAHLSSPSW